MLALSFNNNVTIRKSYEVNHESEDLPTPMLIVCSDPPHNDTKTNIIEITEHYKEAIKQLHLRVPNS